MVKHLVLCRRAKWYRVQTHFEDGVGMVEQLHMWLLMEPDEASYTYDLSMVERLVL
ncbi:MAG: hypothetical protein HC899_36895 [Leptolyngbyaceae cyanobacterium SM1_4_3]|nr:hypothetical protein [Leptolyngbyaceae cyanobacterium SM1_4_3]